MGLYDGYRLANSSRIQEYQGSPVPEMVQVSQEMQKRYDQTLNTNDYTSRFLNSVEAHPKDQKAWQEIAGQYKTKLADMSQRPDLENATREASMLAQQLPTDYAPFAANLKSLQERQEEIRKATEKKPGDAGYLSQQDAANLWNYEYSTYSGLQKDGGTGKYGNFFKPGTYTSTIDGEKFVDNALEKAIPQTTGGGKYYHDSTGKYLITSNGERVELSPGRIKSIISTAVQSNPEIQNYIAQLQKWGTANSNYNIDPSTLNLDKNSKLKELLDRGVPINDAIKKLQSDEIANNYITGLHNYGITKYQQNDVKNHISVNEDAYELKNADDYTIPITTQIQQPLNGYQFTDIKDVHNAASTATEMKGQLNSEYGNFMKGTTQTGSQADGTTKWFKTTPNGKQIDVTDQARKILFAYNQANAQESQWKKRIEDVYDRAGIKSNSALVKDAEDIKAKVSNLLKNVDVDKVGIANVLDNVKDEKLQKYLRRAYSQIQTQGLEGKSAGTGSLQRLLSDYAYTARIEDSNEYNKVNEILEEDNKNGMQLVGITSLPSDKANKAISEQFNNLAVGLDNGSLKQGALGLEWAAGDKPGTPLTKDDYTTLKGKGTYAGNGLVDGKMYMYFNIDNTVKSASGEIKGDKVLVRTPAFNGVVETMVKHNQVDAAQLMISDGVSAALDNPNKTGEAVPGTGIRIEGVPNSVRNNAGAAMGEINLKVVVPLSTGGEKVYNVNSSGEATNLIYKILKAH